MSAQNTGGGFATVISARHAIGHDAEGNLMLVSIDGKSWDHGIDLNGFAHQLIKLGMVNGINLDGGGSESAVVNGSNVNYPSDLCGENGSHGTQVILFCLFVVCVCVFLS
jgi:N-acetylglucosamine-1-phosphodiester alpha-N-acetylglucosaminidase